MVNLNCVRAFACNIVGIPLNKARVRAMQVARLVFYPCMQVLLRQSLKRLFQKENK